MENRKRKLSDIGKQTRVKVQKQDFNHEVSSYCVKKKFANGEDVFVVTSLNETDHNLRSNDFKNGQEPEVFTKAHIQVNTSKQETKNNTSSAIKPHDIKGNTKNDYTQFDTKNNTKVYLRDDSGYQSEDLFESPSSSDSDEIVRAGKCSYYNKAGSPMGSPKNFVNHNSRKWSEKAKPFDIKRSTCVIEDMTDTKDAGTLKSQSLESDEKTAKIVEYDEDESDVITPCDCTDAASDKRPKLVDKRWARKSLDSDIGEHLFKYGTVKRANSLPERLRRMSSIEPEQKSTIYIPHKYADRPIGDEFGAEVWTYRTIQKDGTVYNQHYFVNVEPKGPAAKMKIHDNDEIVLLNDKFVPNVTHTDLLNLFHRVKVDGKTRFRLILRRIEKPRSKKECEWINTSAILAPDCRHDLDNYPEVEKPKFTSVTGAGCELHSVQYYKVPGTQYYLDIKNDSVFADVWNNTDADKTKRICRRVHFSVNSDHHVQFTATLCSEISSKYIVVDQQQIKLDNNPMWFDMTTEAPNIMFKINGRYLACNKETRQVEVDDSEYMFEEVPADEGIDHPDNSVMLCDGMSECNAITFPSRKPAASGFAGISKDIETTHTNGICPLTPVSSKMSCDESVFEHHRMDTESKEKMPCTECVKNASESNANHMTLDIPKTNIPYVRRSSEILKTPTTPFNSLFIVN